MSRLMEASDCRMDTEGEPIHLDIPPPGVGVKEVQVPAKGSDISIVLTPQNAFLEGSNYSLGTMGAASIGVAVTMSDRTLRSGSVSRNEVDHAVQKLNNGEEVLVVAELDVAVGSDAYEPDADVTPDIVAIDSVLGLNFAGEGVGNMIWGYNLDLARLRELDPDRFST